MLKTRARVLARLNLGFAVYAMLAPVAHVLDLPNKLALDGRLWLAVQQHLYRGWGPFIGGPAETGAFATTLALIAWYWTERVGRVARVTALGCYGAMLAVFFTLNAPVNAVVAKWKAAMPPADWRLLRIHWEAGHATAAVLAIIAFVCLLSAYRSDDRALAAGSPPRSRTADADS